MDMEKAQVVRIKDTIKKFSGLIGDRIAETSDYAKKVQLENPGNKERYYHDGMADQAVGIKLLFEELFFEELRD